MQLLSVIKKWAGSQFRPHTKPDLNSLGIGGCKWVLIFWNQKSWNRLLVPIQEPITLSQLPLISTLDWPHDSNVHHQASRYPTMTNHEVRPMSTIYSSQATMVSDDPNHFKSSNFTHVLLENYMKSDHNQRRDTSNLKRRLPVIAFSTVVLYPFQCLRWLMFLILSVGVFIWNSYVFFFGDFEWN